jgi:hypothetical protein
LATLLSQFALPALQAAMPHAPPAQLGEPFGVMQRLPQNPQLVSDPVRSVSQSDRSWSQSPLPCIHIET